MKFYKIKMANSCAGYFMFQGPQNCNYYNGPTQQPQWPQPQYSGSKLVGVGPLIIKAAYHLFVHQPT